MSDYAAKQLPITRATLSARETVFADDIVIQHLPGHFIVSFYQLMPPIIVGETLEERQQSLAGLSDVEAQCVARIVLTPEGMQQLMQHTIQNYDEWTQKATSAQAQIEGNVSEE
jgi:hypothetical protein